MALSIPDIIDRLLDNANAGKVVTHVGAGLALAVPLLMLVNLASNLSVLPADRTKELSGLRDRAVQDLEAQRRALRPLLAAVGTEAQAAVTDEALYGWATREIARLSARVETIDSTVKAFMAHQPLPKQEIASAIDQKAGIAAHLDPLVSQKDLVDTADERLQTIDNQLADAHSFAANLEVFTNNISAVMAFAVVLGVVLSQVSRLVFVNLIYDRRISRTKISSSAAIKAGLVTKEAHDELVRDYYRYVEGCINMVGPVLMFALLFPLYAHARLAGISNGYLVAIGVTALLSAVALAVGGFFTYREYRNRVNQLVLTGDVDKVVDELDDRVTG
jgi:hypothetical protein